VAKANHGQLREAALAALRTGAADRAVYEPWLILRHESPPSSNKGVLANVAGALADPRRLRSPVLSWAEWWVEQPLHEREALSPSGSYRPDMDIGALALAGIALDAGRRDLALRLLARAQAGVGYLLLGAGPSPPRAVTDQGRPGRPMIVLGDGKLEPLPDSGGAPYIVQAGKRGHVRADLRDTGDADGVEGSAFAGSWSYTRGWELTALALQASGLPYRENAVAWEHGVYAQIIRRWPELVRWGFTAEQSRAGRTLIEHPADVDSARAIVAMVSAAPTPALPFDFVAYADSSKFAVAWELDESSTGGRAIAGQYAHGGVTVAASRDTGGRARDDIRRQKVIETAGAFECFWPEEPAQRLAVDKPRNTAEAWRASILPLDGVRFSIAGRPPSLDDTQEIDLPFNQTPDHREHTLRVRPMSVAECRVERVAEGSWIVLSSSLTARIRDIHAEESSGEMRRWVIEP